MPTTRFSTMSTRPKPCRPATAARRATRSAAVSRSPFRATGTPCSNATTISAGSAGVRPGPAVSAKASAGGSVQGSSSGPHSIVRPQRFSSTEYVLASSAIGIDQRAACARAWSRDIAASRTGAMISRSGARAAKVVSNRTWSFPFPVHPWATAPAPISRATSTTLAAMSGRASAETSGYLPS